MARGGVYQLNPNMIFKGSQKAYECLYQIQRARAYITESLGIYKGEKGRITTPRNRKGVGGKPLGADYEAHS